MVDCVYCHLAICYRKNVGDVSFGLISYFKSNSNVNTNLFNRHVVCPFPGVIGAVYKTIISVQVRKEDLTPF